MRIFPEELAARAQELVLTFRASMMSEIERARCLNGACAVWSMWPGYLEQPGQKRLLSFFERHGIPLVTHHASGHAYFRIFSAWRRRSLRGASCQSIRSLRIGLASSSTMSRCTGTGSGGRCNGPVLVERAERRRSLAYALSAGNEQISVEVSLTLPNVTGYPRSAKAERSFLNPLSEPALTALPNLPSGAHASQ